MKFTIPLLELRPQFFRLDLRPETWTEHKPGKWLGDRNHKHTGKCWHEVSGFRHYHVPVEMMAEAQGIQFLCPVCFLNNGRNGDGVHQILLWSRSRGVPDDADPGPGRWKMVGTGFADLTLDADPPSKKRSVLLTGGCRWHGYVTKGVVN